VLPIALAKARAHYPVNGRESMTTLVVTNTRRISINTQLNTVHAQRHVATFVAYDGDNVKCQSVYLWIGIVLQAVVTERTGTHNLKNALRFRVLAVDDASTTLALIDDKGRQGSEFMKPTELAEKPYWNPFDMLTSMVPHKFVPTHAITYDSSQARTLHGGVRMTQTDHPCMTLRKLIVGLGRAPLGVDVQVE